MWASSGLFIAVSNTPFHNAGNIIPAGQLSKFLGKFCATHSVTLILINTINENFPSLLQKRVANMHKYVSVENMICFFEITEN